MRPRTRETLAGSHVGTEAPAPFELPPAPAWMAEALCAQMPSPDVFFPDHASDGLGEARAICSLCPVRGECLQYSLDIDARFGVFGGLSEAQRSRLRKGGAA